MIGLNRSHDPARRSWLASANDPATDFPIQNLPFGIFREGGVTRVGVAIGDRIVDLTRARRSELFFGAAAEAASAAAGTILNPLMRLGHAHAGALRAALGDGLDARADSALRARIEAWLVPMAAAELLLPVEILGLFTKPFALCIRLFANMVAGHIVIFFLLGLILGLSLFSIFLILVLILILSF